ncbi:hypothetical protein [Marinobacter sp. BGYM27]|uniref:hypothetical protein n=1 Tax=Marinobacter sp. BGYM27 TaxID=2975597 RepID=UPI0021A94316|nr:hypothetical protein [Marinobacter sp. BGYM27]MDG5498718.1 hypothetical protein [Marinobacter sp. BGYM27]
MSEKDANSERYIKIARACLRAINNSGPSEQSREEKVQLVYDAIDDAFQHEFEDYRQSLAVMSTVLERIASGQLDAEASADLARKTLGKSGYNAINKPVH